MRGSDMSVPRSAAASGLAAVLPCSTAGQAASNQRFSKQWGSQLQAHSPVPHFHKPSKLCATAHAARSAPMVAIWLRSPHSARNVRVKASSSTCTTQGSAMNTREQQQGTAEGHNLRTSSIPGSAAAAGSAGRQSVQPQRTSPMHAACKAHAVLTGDTKRRSVPSSGFLPFVAAVPGFGDLSAACGRARVNWVSSAAQLCSKDAASGQAAAALGSGDVSAAYGRAQELLLLTPSSSSFPGQPTGAHSSQLPRSTKQRSTHCSRLCV